MASKPPKDDLSEAKRIAAKMLAMPPAPHGDSKPKKAKPGAKKAAKLTSGKRRARAEPDRT
jgi:hypothetical protein